MAIPLFLADRTACPAEWWTRHCVTAMLDGLWRHWLSLSRD